jgi:hypothetical protein
MGKKRGAEIAMSYRKPSGLPAMTAFKIAPSEILNAFGMQDKGELHIIYTLYQKLKSFLLT